MVDGLLKLLVCDGFVAEHGPNGWVLASCYDTEEVIWIVVVKNGLSAQLCRGCSASARSGS